MDTEVELAACFPVNRGQWSYYYSLLIIIVVDYTIFWYSMASSSASSSTQVRYHNESNHSNILVLLPHNVRVSCANMPHLDVLHAQ